MPAAPAPAAGPRDRSTHRLRIDGRTAASLTCGATGLFMFNIVFGPIAIVLGALALRRGTAGDLGRAGAVLGILLGVADLVVLAVMLATAVSGDGLHWRLGA
jgi:hypothetical protein